jgi:hypothetical protein
MSISQDAAAAAKEDFLWKKLCKIVKPMFNIASDELTMPRGSIC